VQQRVQEAHRLCGISDVVVFKQWQAYVINTFRSQNACAMSLEKIATGPIESHILIEMLHCMVNLLVHSQPAMASHSTTCMLDTVTTSTSLKAKSMMQAEFSKSLTIKWMT
jgi:hypothetical protein